MEEQPWGWPLTDLYNSLCDMLRNLIKGTMEGCFGLIDGVTEIANTEMAKTPATYDTNIFDIVKRISETVIIPIGAVILTYIVLYEFITAIMDKNNFHEFDTSIFFRFIIKTGIAVYFMANIFTIVNAFFDLGTYIVTNTTNEFKDANTLAAAMAGCSGCIDTLGLGTLFSMLIPIGFLNIVSIIIYMCVYVILIGRMIEIYVHLSIAPIPLATITNRDFGDTGKNYLKTIFAFVLQAFFIILCIGIFRMLILSIGDNMANIAVIIAKGNKENLNISWAINEEIFKILAYGVVLVLTMFKSGSVAKSILGAH